MTLRMNLRECFLFFIFMGAIFINPLSLSFPFPPEYSSFALRIYNVCVFLFFTTYFLLHFVKNNMAIYVPYFMYKVTLCFALLALFGIIGTLIFKIQTDFKPIFEDFITTIRLPICILGFYYFSKQIEIERFLFTLSYIFKFLIFIMFCGAIINLFIPFSGAGERMGGIPVYTFIYRHGSVTTITCILLGSVIAIASGLSKKNYPFFMMLAVIMLCSLRATAVGILAFSIILFILIKMKKKMNLIHVGFLLLLLVLLVLPQLKFYYGSIGNYSDVASGEKIEDASGRTALLLVGIYNAIEHFPIGTGFATFGSYAAKVYYSPLYHKFNFNKYHGLGEEKGAFLNDVMWGVVFGQFGFFGFFVILATFFFLFQKSKDIQQEGSLFVWQLIVVYLFLNTIGNMVWFNFVFYPLFMVLILNIHYASYLENEKKEIMEK